MTTGTGSVTAQEIRVEVRAWIAAHWGPDLSLVGWRTRLVESGWACPAWPRRWMGRGLPAWAGAVVADELTQAGAIGPPEGVGAWLAGPTILEHGDDGLRDRLLRPTLVGTLSWCQLFSEPGAGSDLAGLATRAERDGDQWVVDGQKVWTTGAHHADVGLLLARTDTDAPKHRGLTCMVLPMRQSGVTVRPLRQMNGHASFNEVFLDRAVVPGADVIGPVGGGWAVALTTLAHERRVAPNRSARPSTVDSRRAIREAAAEHAVASAPYVWYPQRAGRPDLLADRVGASGRGDDPVLRQAVGRVAALTRVAGWTAGRAAAARQLGRPPGAEGSLGKLASSRIARASAAAHADIAGASAMLTGPGADLGGTVAEILVSVPAVSIAGGTDEIQHTIIGERILGLPREPAVDRDVPWRDIPGPSRLRRPPPTGPGA